MKNKLVWFVVFLVTYSITNIAVQFFSRSVIDTWQVLAAAAGILIAFMNVALQKNLAAMWIRVVLIALFAPIALVGLVSLILSLISIDFAGWVMLGVYVLGVLAVLYLAVQFRSKLFQDPVLDERNLMHFAWRVLCRSYFLIS